MTTMSTEQHGRDRWALLIPGWFPPSLNGVNMAHWSTVRKHKAKALNLVYIHAVKAGGVPKFEGRVRLTIIRLIGKRGRKMDTENLYGAVKPLVDAMREQRSGRNQRGANRHGGIGIFRDDNPDDLELIVEQCKAAVAGHALGAKELSLSILRELDADAGGTLIIVEGKRVA